MSRISRSVSCLPALLVLTINLQAQVSSASALPSTGVISGHVTTGGQPVPGVAIILQPFDAPTVKSPLPRTITDEEGDYRLAGVPEGRYVVTPVVPAFVVAGGPAADKAGTRIYGLPTGKYLVSVSDVFGLRHFRKTFHPDTTDQKRSI